MLSARQDRVRTTLPAACTGRVAALRTCRVTLTDGAGRVLGSTRVASTGARRLAVPVALNASGRRLLRARRSPATLLLRARAVDVGGQARSARTTVRVLPSTP